MTTPMSEATESYTTYRVALASGILGSAGATIGWIIWIAFEARSVPLVLSVAVGVTLGLIVEWVRHYIHVARRENLGENLRTAKDPSAWWRRNLIRAGWATGFGLIGLVTEHVVAHVAADYFRPFLASLVSLLPAGMIIGWTMSRGRSKDENLLMLLGNGILVGIAIAVVTGLLWSIGFGTPPWAALVAWWSLIGIATRIMARDGRLRVQFGDPVGAVILTFILIFGINRLPITASTYKWLGPFSTGAMTIRAMAMQIQQSPDLPATFWLQAEATRQKEKAAENGMPEPAVPTNPVTVVDTSARKSPPVDLQRAVDYLTGPDSAASVPGLAHLTQWIPDTTTPAFRSWFVILLFGVGLGAAPWVERRLRPMDYPNSETYRNDFVLTIVTVVAISAACIYGTTQQG